MGRLKPNLKNLYQKGNFWCGRCGELRDNKNKTGRCPDCNAVLRSHPH